MFKLKSFRALIGFLTFIYPVCSISAPAQQSPNFNKSHVMVHFDPRVAIDVNKTDYDESDLITFVKLVSTRFSKILIDPLLDDNQNISKVANAVANYNKLHRASPNDPPTQLWIHVPFHSHQRNDSLKHLEHIRDVVEAANYIFNGSVEGIIFNSDYFLHNSINNTENSSHGNVNEIKRIFRKEAKFSYKLGLMFNQRRIFSNVPEYYNISIAINAIDACCIMTFITPTSNDIEKGVNSTISKYQKILEKTSKDIKGLNTTQYIMPMFRTGYPDTSNNSQAKNKYRDLVQFWKNMGEFAAKTNATMAFIEAFDMPERPTLASRSLGWWRRVQDEDDENIFQEKSEAPLEHKFESLIIEDKNAAYFHQGEHFDFRRNSRFSVVFNPHMHFSSKNVSEIEVDSKMKIYLDKIQEKFRGILIRNDELSLEDLSNISKSLARQNNNVGESYQAKNLINVSFVFTPTLQGNTNTSNDWNDVDLFRQMKVITGRLGNVVSSVQISFSEGFNQTKMKGYVVVLALAKGRLTIGAKSGELLYKFGVELPLNVCKKRLDSVIRPMSHLVEVVTLKHLSTDADHEMGVAKTTEKIIKAFNRCRKRIEELENGTGKANGIHTMLSVGWRDTNKNGEKDYESFLKFWREIGAWAVRENVNVVMAEAFDNPGKREQGGLGWWEMVKNGRSGLGYDFVEKRKVLLDELPTIVGDFTESPTGPKIDSQDTTSATTTEYNFPGNGNESFVISQKKFPQSVEKGIGIGNGGSGDMSEHEWWFITSWVVPTVIAVIVATVLASVVVYKLKRNPRELTKEEEKEFLEGNSRFGDHLGEELYINSRYNAEQHEIPLQNIAFDSVIGSGKFAIFYKAVLADAAATVAVKVPKKVCTKQYYKSMLMEVKIMANAGDHVNVLKFYGANAKDVQKGMVYIINEYCENGSLYCFLRTLRYNLDSAEDEQSKKLNNVYDLYKFAYEISSGMHYLAEKDIIHGDLSASNVLLDGNNICKIYNFGLTRKLDQNGEYAKRNEESFPWRWIAVETLKHKIVTGKSDIWSFGVALWEIFSLGRIPFKSHVQEGFLEKMEKGLRLKRPKYATQVVYENMMQCWSKNPTDRPRFSEHAQYFLLLMKEESDVTV